MAIKRFIATKDATITNSYKESLVTSASLSNTGRADSLQTHVIYGQTLDTGTNRVARILLEFPINNITASIDAGHIPTGTDNVQYWLRLFNVKHPDTLPRQYTLAIHPVTAAWEEGFGLDLDTWSDTGSVNWQSASEGTVWGSAGGDFNFADAYYQYFDNGDEDLEVNITEMVSDWFDGTYTNNGLIVTFLDSFETGTTSYYKKMFSARSSEYFFSRPVIEVRWDDSIQDDRAYSFQSASIADATDNTNTIYFYNWVRGELQDLPNSPTEISMSLYATSSGTGLIGGAYAGPVDTGTYTASFVVNQTGSVYDYWTDGSGTTYWSGTFDVKSFYDENYYIRKNDRFVISCLNLNSHYDKDDVPRFQFFIRKKNWNPTVYNIVQATQETLVIPNMWYRIIRTVDKKEVIRFGTGSLDYTKTSFNKDGNYFDLDMGLLEPDYQYEINLLFKINNEYIEYDKHFKFRVIDHED